METLLAHAGMNDDNQTNNNSNNAPLAPPLHVATTYERPASGVYGPNDAHYTRLDNPTRLLLEREMARLETHGGVVDDDHDDDTIKALDAAATCCAFASGMMAVSSIVLAHQAPLVVIVPVDLYHGVPTVLWDVFARFQVSVMRVDVRDTVALSSALGQLNRSDNENVETAAVAASSTASSTTSSSTASSTIAFYFKAQSLIKHLILAHGSWPP